MSAFKDINTFPFLKPANKVVAVSAVEYLDTVNAVGELVIKDEFVKVVFPTVPLFKFVYRLIPYTGIVPGTV